MTATQGPASPAGLVVVDRVRGHIAAGGLVFADTGPVLHVWAYSGTTLTPQSAWALGKALLGWSDKRTCIGCPDHEDCDPIYRAAVLEDLERSERNPSR